VIEAVFRVVAVWPAMKGANSPKMRIIEANRSAILTKLAVVAVVAVVATCTKWVNGWMRRVTPLSHAD
jgi:hypothetical protein